MITDLQETEGWTDPRPASTTRFAQCVVGTTALLSSVFGVGTIQPITLPQVRPAAVNDWTQQKLVRRVPTTHVSRTSSSISVAPEQSGQPTSRVAGTAEQVRFVHERSGLTWEQLGRLFGVSRRAVHNWASGSRLSAGNAELLARVVAVLESRQGYDPNQTRAWLLASSAGGVSRFDELRHMGQHGTPIEDVIDVRERLGLA